MTAEELRARRDALEAELAEVDRELRYADCPGEGRCHGCMVWCDRCGDVGVVCDAATCDRHRCIGCNTPVTNTEHIYDGWARCPEHWAEWNAS